ncbi:MAG TPA: RNA-binding S4 domain-containing protein [Bacillota bacterium]|nr:RNA-binding S4 domain-containing protein [Bacillota bacterium]HOK68102.1 RNA-binding S4 domain-containing protein [Bacillota bacterium]HPP84404.1 RNA-binding S4 domain-containing protein [Bacillota bacterium]
MRLDKYLKVSRIIKRRTVANEACDNSYVTVNGRPAKASYEVKIGDIIEIKYGNRTTKFKVLSIDEHAKKANASEMYEVLLS